MLHSRRLFHAPKLKSHSFIVAQTSFIVSVQGRYLNYIRYCGLEKILCKTNSVTILNAKREITKKGKKFPVT